MKPMLHRQVARWQTDIVGTDAPHRLFCFPFQPNRQMSASLCGPDCATQKYVQGYRGL